MEEIYNITQAKAQLSRIIAKIEETGEEVILSRAGKPTVRIAPLKEEPSPHKRLGYFDGQFKIPDDWDEWPEEEARALGIID